MIKYDSEFERLSKDLNDEERRDLLRKLKKDENNLKEEKTNKDKEENVQIQLKIAKSTYLNYSIFTKFFIWLISIFTARTKEEVVLDRLFNDIRREIQYINNSIIDFKNNLITNNFAEEILNLAEICNAAIPIIDIFFADTAFYNNFICYVFEENFDTDLKNSMNELKPENYEINTDFVEREDFFNEKEIRERAFFNKLSLLSFIEINRMFSDFEILVRLITFDFKTLLIDFSNNQTDMDTTNKYGIKFSLVNELLEKLYIILNAINFTYDDIDFIEKIVDYKKNNIKQNDISNDAVLNKINDIMRKIFLSIENIKNKIPFKEIFQYFKKDLLYKPPRYNIKFDILNIYKNYKKSIITSEWENYFDKIRENNQNKLMEDLFKDYKFNTLDNFNIELKNNIEMHSHIKVKNVKKLNLLANFINKIYKREIEKVINKVIVEGTFAKESERNSYTSAYYILYNSLEIIKDFDKNLEPEKEYGNKIATFIKISTHDVNYAQSLQHTILDINDMSNEILEDTYNALWNIGNLINNLAKQLNKEMEVVSNIDSIKVPGFISASQAVIKIKKRFDLFFKIYNIIEDY